MEASALKYQAGIGLHTRSPLLRLQSDERLITLLRRGNVSAFEVLFARYETRLLSFCRHLLGSREDAEDVLQEVMTAAFNAIVADERPINVRPWLYRIARNRSLNHLRKTQAIAVDSMDHHLAEHGATTADKVHEREQFRLLVGDIQELPETQRTALVLREMDALSYEQIAEAMETTVSSVKSLLVRARMGLAEAAEARQLTCEEVRLQLAEVAEGLLKKPDPLVRRHMKGCKRCADFRGQLKATNKALAVLLPVGPLVVFKKLAFLHLGHSAGAGAGASAGSTATAAGSGAAGAGAASAGAGAAIGSGVFGGGSVVSAGMGAVATKAAAGLAAAVIVTAGAVEVDHQTAHHPAAPVAQVPVSHLASPIAPVHSFGEKPSSVAVAVHHVVHHAVAVHHTVVVHPVTTTTHAATTPTITHTTPVTTTATTATTATTTTVATTTGTATMPTTTTTGRVQTQTDPTVLPPTTSTPAPPIPTATDPAPVTTTTEPTSTTGTTASGTTTGSTTTTDTTTGPDTTTGGSTTSTTP